MDGYIKIKKSDLIEVMWSICLSEHLGDIWESIEPFVELLEIPRNISGMEELLEKMQEMDLIPDYHREL